MRWREFGSDGILLDPASGEYLQIDEIGLAIWKCFEAPATIADVTDAICVEFDDVNGQAADDIQEFVAALTERRFLLVDVP